MLKNKKILFGIPFVVLVFFAITFSKNWGTAVTVNLLEKYKPEVKQLKSDPIAAAQVCPTIIAKLEKGMPELEKGKDPDKVQVANKLIADCAFAAKMHEKSIEYYKKLSAYEPNYPRWYALIAESMLASDKAGDALHYSVLASRLDPANFTFQRLNARILAKLGLKNRAIDAYAHAIKIAPYDDIAPTKLELEKYIQDSEYTDESTADGTATE